MADASNTPSEEEGDAPSPDLPDADYEIFIEGETIDLVIPRDVAVHRDKWHSWFNDPKVTRYSDHGLWPNTPEKQLQFLERTTHAESDRLVLLIRPKGMRRATGVISLSGINFLHRMAQVGMVIGAGPRGAGALFHGLEAKARIAEHAFDTMGLERVWGSQARPLADWQRFQVLFGFRVEGVLRHAFRRGQTVHELILTACTLDDYNAVKAARGAYWPGKSRLLELMRACPSESPVESVADAIDEANRRYVDGLDL